MLDSGRRAAGSVGTACASGIAGAPRVLRAAGLAGTAVVAWIGWLGGVVVAGIANGTAAAAEMAGAAGVVGPAGGACVAVAAEALGGVRAAILRRSPAYAPIEGGPKYLRAFIFSKRTQKQKCRSWKLNGISNDIRRGLRIHSHS